jgi:hypothetical protein
MMPTAKSGRSRSEKQSIVAVHWAERIASDYCNCHATTFGVMQRKAAQTSGGLLFVATECVRADTYFMLLSFDSSLTVALSS